MTGAYLSTTPFCRNEVSCWQESANHHKAVIACDKDHPIGPVPEAGLAAMNGGTMNARVIYQSTTGNTRQVAESMAAAAGCTAESVADAVISTPVDMLFLGASIHGGDIDPIVKTFIE